MLQPVKVFAQGRAGFWVNHLFILWMLGLLGPPFLLGGAMGLLAALVQHRWHEVLGNAVLFAGGLVATPLLFNSVKAVFLPSVALEGPLEHVRELVHKKGRRRWHFAVSGRDFSIPALRSSHFSPEALLVRGRPCRLEGAADGTVFELTVDAAAEVRSTPGLPPEPAQVAPLDDAELRSARRVVWRCLALRAAALLVAAGLSAALVLAREWFWTLAAGGTALLLAYAVFGWVTAARRLGALAPGAPCQWLEGNFGDSVEGPRMLGALGWLDATGAPPHRLSRQGRARGLRLHVPGPGAKWLFVVVEWLAVVD